MRIAVVGGYGVGISVGLDRFPAAGETIGGDYLEIGHGGKGSNQAVGAARLGASVSLLTAVGNDSAGKNALELWITEGIDSRYVVHGTRSTMTGIIMVERSGENRIIVVPGALDEIGAEEVSKFRQEISQADMLVVSLEVPVTVGLRALEIAKEEGTATILNPAPGCSLPDHVWRSIDILTPNRVEAMALIGETDPEDSAVAPELIVSRLRTKYHGAIVMTLGGEGVLLDQEGTATRIPAPAVSKVVDTTGAGDAFTAALAVAVCQGHSLPEACVWAAAAGAHAVQYPGVIAALPYLDQLRGVPSR